MTYADITLDRPTNESFTYAITPEQLPQIHAGSLVEVPFGRRTEFGIVTQLRRRVTPDLATKLRPITRVLAAYDWAPKTTLHLAESLHRYGGQSVGSCLFRLLPQPGKRLIAPSQSSPTHHQPTPNRRLHLYGGDHYRLTQLATLIRRSLERGRQVLIVAPNYRLQSFQAAIAHLAVTTLVTGEMSPTAQRTAANAWRSGHCRVLIGTRQIVGWPAADLGLIIVDDPLHYAHTDDQRPYLDTSTIALLRAPIERCHVVLAAPLPTLGMTLVEARREAQRLTAEPSPPTLLLQVQERGSWLNDAILTRLRNARQGLIVAPRAGSGGTLHCEHCATPATCPNCLNDIELSTQPYRARCPSCGWHDVWPTHCAACSSDNLRLIGVGTEAITRDLTRALGTIPPQLTVGTEQLLESARGTVVLAFADSPLASPDLQRTERYLSRIRTAMSQADQLIVSTRHPDNPWWRTLGTQSQTAFRDLLIERRTHHLTPYVRRLQIESRDPISLPDLPSTVTCLPSTTNGHAMMELLVAPEQWSAVLAAIRRVATGKWHITVDSLLAQR